ncbi:MAG: sugar ABC transporter ATP-binding protein [Clostridiales bacterium]|nr:sugar ABC transporter ATP-binding protein [Clostridiales bacterium]
MLLEMRNIEKSFNGTPALRNVDFTLERGEVHGLVGENGAGKSTLIKLLTGVYSLDAGSILWEGAPLDVRTPAESMAAGISVIHQERTLIPGFTAVENAWLGRGYPLRRGRVDWKRMRAEVMEKAKQLDIELDCDMTAADMSPPMRTMTEIVRAMLRDCRLLILDEPTAALTDREAEKLFKLIEGLREKGTSVLYISHRLDEISRLTDRVTVLRNGERVLTERTSSLTQRDLIAAMTENWQGGRVQRAAGAGEALLEVRGVQSADGVVKNASFTARAGEILGVFGLGGSGRTELLECIYGLRPMAEGRMTLRGEGYAAPSPRRSLARGMALIPEDRRGHALVSALSVRENVSLSGLEDFARAGVVSKRRHDEAVDQMNERLDVKYADPEQPVSELSGGNQQKVVFARTLMKAPTVFLCDEPTQAVDVRTRHQIHALLRAQAERGAAVVFVSSDLKELLDTADRILVMARGRTRECLDNAGLTGQQVLSKCYEEF